MKAGNGLLATSESICCLAVERKNCVNLDFSSLSGSASVDFSAIYGDKDNGHDNGAVSGEGATFPTCFKSTPVVVGNARTRNGKQRNTMQLFGISSIDNTDFEEFLGPFELDTDYGAELNNEPVDWTATRIKFEHNMRARGFVKVIQRWRKVSNKRAKRLVNKQFGENKSIINMAFETSEIHALSAQSILDIEPNWDDVKLNKLALTLNGQAVARNIISDDKRLSADDQIIINARQ
ncbi:MAG: hypothetical protein ACJARN_000823 [Arenicella sp.]|jgi:hypothetical protein